MTLKEGDIYRMREVKGYDIPAGGSFEFKPGLLVHEARSAQTATKPTAPWKRERGRPRTAT